MGEASVGREAAGSNSTRLLVEANCTNPLETHLAWLQLRHTAFSGNGPEERFTEARVGYRARIAKGWSLSAQLIQPLDQPSNRSLAPTLSLQVRLRL